MEKQTREIYERVKTIIRRDRGITLENVMAILVKSMELVEKIPGLDGKQKKEIVMEVLFLILQDIPLLDSEEKLMIIEIARSKLAEQIVDLLAGAAKGVYRINESRIKRFKRKICPCCYPEV